jgi:hypothetical protein
LQLTNQINFQLCRNFRLRAVHLTPDIGQEPRFTNESEISIFRFNTPRLATVRGMPALKIEIEGNCGHPLTHSAIPTSNKKIAAYE